MKDNDIRTTLIDELNKINAKHDYRIVEELVVCDGEARVDVAVANKNCVDTRSKVMQIH